MAKITGLGRGLSALIPRKILPAAVAEENKEVVLSPAEEKVWQLPVSTIEANPMQPRRVFNSEDLEELIDSIKVHGIIQPLIVSKVPSGYQLIAGERRLRAAQFLELATVPALVRQVKEQEKLELALIENVQRRNLNPIEKGLAYQRLIEEFNLTQEAAAGKLGISRAAVNNTIRLLSLPEAVQTALADGRISEGHAKVIAGLPTEKAQLSFLNKILRSGLTVRQTEVQTEPLRKRRAQSLARDPIVEDREAQLREKLNTKVNIKKKDEAGQIIIDFYSEEELGEIVKKILD